MAENLEEMSGEEFITEVLNGRKDFSKIKLVNGDLSNADGFEKMNCYLKKHLPK